LTCGQGACSVSSDSLKRAKRLVKIVVGFTALLLGIIMLVTPGPGIVAIGFGLALLGAEFVWARRLLNRLKAGGDRLKAEGHRLRDAILPPPPAQKS
jgi:Putative transmembrane protein (PGPGW)